MDYTLLFADPDTKDEFLDRFGELKDRFEETRGPLEGVGGGLEAAAAGLNAGDAESAVGAMQEGSWVRGNSGLEAIIERFTRPVCLVQDSQISPPPDDFVDSDSVMTHVDTARAVVEPRIPSVGRIDLRNSAQSWAGTGWVVAPGVVATNRHVAALFARSEGDGFAYRTNFNGRQLRATMDWRREYNRGAESRFAVTEIIWIEPDGQFDVALLRIADSGEGGEAQPEPIDLLDAEYTESAVGKWVSVIGYPARDSRNDFADQQRIFDGVYNVKRFAPGRITAATDRGLIEHDATTLGGNSGSAVVDLETGKVAGIHFGGIEGEENYAVQAPHLAEIVRLRAM